MARIIPPLHRELFPRIELIIIRIDLRPQKHLAAGLRHLQLRRLFQSPLGLCLLERLGLLLPLGQFLLQLALLEARLEPVVVLGLAAEADAEAVAVAGVLGGAEDVLAREDDLPDVLPHPAGDVVAERGAEEPVAEEDEARERDGEDAGFGEGELGAAGLGQHFGDGVEGEELAPGFGQHCFFLFVGVFFERAGVHPVRTARVPVAAHVHVAFARDPLAAQPLDHLDGVVVEEVVVVPAPSVGVHEDHDVW